jgi:hypothetical protein
MELKNRLLEVISDNFKSQADAAGRMNMKRQNLNSLIKNGSLSYDFTVKLKHAVPQLNMNWLLTGEGLKYLSEEELLQIEVRKRIGKYEKAETEIIDLLKNQVEDLRSQINFLQEQIKHGRQKEEEKGK